MPEYLTVIDCACAGARLSNTAGTAAAIMRMKSLPEVPLLFHNGRRRLTCLSINQAALVPPCESGLPPIDHHRLRTPSWLRSANKQNARRKAGRRIDAVLRRSRGDYASERLPAACLPRSVTTS